MSNQLKTLWPQIVPKEGRPFHRLDRQPQERENGGAAEGHVVEVEEGGRDAIAALQLIQILAVVVHVGLVVTPDPVRYDLISKWN